MRWIESQLMMRDYEGFIKWEIIMTEIIKIIMLWD
jgi:hypothetical protein